jgi:hypothetical protein
MFVHPYLSVPLNLAVSHQRRVPHPSVFDGAGFTTAALSNALPKALGATRFPPFACPGASHPVRIPHNLGCIKVTFVLYSAMFAAPSIILHLSRQYPDSSRVEPRSQRANKPQATPAESTVTQNVPLTPLESALTKSPSASHAESALTKKGGRGAAIIVTQKRRAGNAGRPVRPPWRRVAGALDRLP